MISNIASRLSLSRSSSPNSSVQTSGVGRQPSNLPIPVNYTHNPVPIPSTFLTAPAASPITSRTIDFASSSLPQYDGHLALVLDNVLSPLECRELIELAEASVPRKEGTNAWRPALVSLGPGWEAPAPGYRESDRIIWDQQTVVDRLWRRCAQADGLGELLSTAEREPWRKSGRWEFRRFNDRMRFLKYSPGQYFKRKFT